MARRPTKVRIGLIQWGGSNAPVDYLCGWCGCEIGSTLGMEAMINNRDHVGSLRVCPVVAFPSFIAKDGEVTPPVS